MSSGRRASFVKTTQAYRHVDAAVRKLSDSDHLRPGIHFILLEFLAPYSFRNAWGTDVTEVIYRLSTIPAGFRHVRMLIVKVVKRLKEDGGGLDLSGRAYDFDDGSSERQSPLDPFIVQEHWAQTGRVVTQRDDALGPSSSSALKKTADWRQSVWGYDPDSGLLAMGTTTDEASAVEIYVPSRAAGRGMKEYTLHNNNCAKYAYQIAKGAISQSSSPSLVSGPHWGSQWAVLLRRNPAVVFWSQIAAADSQSSQGIDDSQLVADRESMDRGFGVPS
ncbi:hypothetical protein QBC37DRAFT_479876 [Rhypophila decipiens]|uniref:Uncharacterized protein n=1 Tax=Rhypophila decipiens TaxID=261697 RepID=A0AAN6YJ91_9PEZI|nr:hypothetical protein QBC37DRAFT_479876 [Rhypophila decipiens]